MDGYREVLHKSGLQVRKGNMTSSTVPATSMVLPLALLLGSAAGSTERMNFTVWSQPVRLRYGEVYNKLQSPEKLPTHVVARYSDGKKMMALTGFDVDMVRAGADGTELRVQLNDHYLHHYALQFGEAESMRKMLDTASADVSFARMLSGCHAMTRVGVNSFLDRLHFEEPHRIGRVSMFGSAAGAEYRKNPQRFNSPFRALLRRPQVWAPLLHIINTKAPVEAGAEHSAAWSPLIECPCTPQRKINVSAGTIDGRAADPPIHCSPEFAATGNPSCHLATYQGGWRCCEDKMFLIDTAKECANPDCSEKPVDEVHMKFTFFYEDAQPGARQMEGAACCDVTSVTQGDENIEYDVPVCLQGTAPEECRHIAESVQPLAFFDGHPKSPLSSYRDSDLVDLVFAAPHLHLAGISIELIDHLTNKTICEVHRTANNSGGIAYGHGATPGNEDGYLVGLTPCHWGGAEAPRFRRDHPMRTRAVYNASLGHTGVMSLWLMQVSAAADPDFLV
mmetsp:Transcript_64003/g.162208  ORF Transcript_64003/g.162208 Transcript_64003/m.162208 type:complete len:506 (+) Transcript_64003:19-1536(+)